MSRRSKKTPLFSYEHKTEQVISHGAFLWRVLINVGIAIGLIGVSLIAGMCGYHFLERLSWIDSFENASMILSGMGPVDEMKTYWGKLFAGSYAIYSGMVVIAVMGIVLGPPFHRLLHRFHADED